MPQNSQTFKEFIAREIESMTIFLTAKASRSAITIDEYIQTRVLQGASEDVLKADLLKDLTEGGRIFGEFRNAVKATVNGVVNRSRDAAIFSEAGIEQEYRWVAVLINTCPDCLDRHNRVQSWGDWEAEGLPRTGQTVCKENCKCVLLPAKNTETNPIMRK